MSGKVYNEDVDSLMEGSVGYGMAIPDESSCDSKMCRTRGCQGLRAEWCTDRPDEDPNRDNEAFEGWGPGR